MKKNILKLTSKHSYVYDIDVLVSEHDYSTSVQCKTIQRKTTTTMAYKHCIDLSQVYQENDFKIM